MDVAFTMGAGFALFTNRDFSFQAACSPAAFHFGFAMRMLLASGFDDFDDDFLFAAGFILFRGFAV